MKTKSFTPLAIRFADWYDLAYDKYGEGFTYYTNKAEDILKKYLGDKLYNYDTDEAIDLLPEEGRSEIEEFLESNGG